jgi:hypothetical protein
MTVRHGGAAHPENGVFVISPQNPALRVERVAGSKRGVVRTNVVGLVCDCNAFVMGWDIDTAYMVDTICRQTERKKKTDYSADLAWKIHEEDLVLSSCTPEAREDRILKLTSEAEAEA